MRFWPSAMNRIGGKSKVAKFGEDSARSAP